RLDFAGQSAVELDRRIRGCDPQPGARARLGDEVVRLFGCRLETGGSPDGSSRSQSGSASNRESESDSEPGTVIEVGPSGLCLAARGGRLRIAKIRRGEAKRPAHESGLRVGDRLA
ncbi:hypothetical protein K2X89_16680, partial [Myxococcota bacterium]|nr:hypothetical protein [Myxococcota bacterium]